MKDIDFLSGKIWGGLMALMAMTAGIGPVLDYFIVVQGGFGAINNLAILTIIGMVLIFPANLKFLREEGDRRFLIIAFGLMATVVLRTVLDPRVTAIGLFGSVLLLLSVVAGLSCYAFARRGVEVERWVVVVALAAGLLMPVALLFVWLRPEGEVPYYLHVYGYSNIRVLGYFAAGSVVASAVLFAGVRSRIGLGAWAVAALFMIMAWAMLFWSGSRAGLVGVVGSLTVTWFVVARPLWPRLMAIGMSAAAGFAVHLTFPMPSHHFGFVSRVQQTVQAVSTGDATKITTNRSDMWLWVVDKIMDAPVVGYGLYAMSYLRTDEFNFMHTHNVILEFALGVGVPMALLITAVVLTLYVRSAVAAKVSGDPWMSACFALVTVSAVSSQFNAALFFPIYQFLFLAGLSGMVAKWKLHKESGLN